MLAAGAAGATPPPVTLGLPTGLTATFVPEAGKMEALEAAGANPPGHFFHPISTPAGVLTELFPADHLHQRGLFWGWRQILIDGKPVANGWLMTGMKFRNMGVTRSRDGTRLEAAGRWRVGGRDVLEERLSARVVGDMLILDLGLTPMVPGLSLGGSPDDKGYGGISLRLVQSDRLRFESGGRVISPEAGPVEAGPELRMTWDAGTAAPARAVRMACSVNGRAITRWILRREASMQNCVWPGREPVPLPMGEVARLGLRLTVEP
ncbi:hypothetical protein FJQ54_11420 [Sandaracinobacter neustonicus]|uniref:Uncharacterized protein n=1 Tax=Sandaracinobacter neustonicus TaxID=1715348 RepID=A0A501XJZ4_9SPHN|nr:DUF6807 family protein [Sandaracinobacter neustonicus]TPE60594.1 hypothetical protein FJQ54_11420 [Sandaracinobacter neustonicus]